MDTKHCPKCDTPKALDEFNRNKKTADGLRHDCRKCQSEQSKRYRATNRAAIKARKSAYHYANRDAIRSRKLKYMYGISAMDYDALLVAQDGQCAVCTTTDPGRNGTSAGTFCVDHDHTCCPGRNSCGRCVRGLLCHRCNRGIGLLRDNPDVLLAAVDYLLKHA